MRRLNSNIVVDGTPHIVVQFGSLPTVHPPAYKSEEERRAVQEEMEHKKAAKEDCYFHRCFRRPDPPT